MYDNDRLRRLLVKLANKHIELPSLFSLKDVRCVESEPVAAGSFADVYLGTFQDGKVALKCLRSYPKDSLEDSEQKKKVRSFTVSINLSIHNSVDILPRDTDVEGLEA